MCYLQLCYLRLCGHFLHTQFFRGELILFFFLFLSSPKDMLIDFRERGRYREGERNMDVREKH